MQDYHFRTWAQINLDCLTANVKALSKDLGERKIMAVIKANAYGHGDLAVARHLTSLGVDAFAVTSIDEAISLRDGGIEGSILIFGMTPYYMVEDLHRNNFTQAVLSLAHAHALSREAQALGIELSVHVKLDTGMGRVGLSQCDSADCAADVLAIMDMPGLNVEGIFTHLAVADSDLPEHIIYTKHQQEKIDEVYEKITTASGKKLLIHSLNSAGHIYHSVFHSDYARIGIALYGQLPSADLCSPVPLSPVMEIKSAISRVKPLAKGESVSYGCTFTAPSDIVVATVPIGYADGYPRRLSGKAEMLVRGKRALVIGRVCMDQLMLDVTAIPDVQEGDIVTVFGSDGDAYLPLDELAALADTISYEILCAVHMRVPRVYILDGKVVDVVRYI